MLLKHKNVLIPDQWYGDHNLNLKCGVKGAVLCL